MQNMTPEQLFVAILIALCLLLMWSLTAWSSKTTALKAAQAQSERDRKKASERIRELENLERGFHQVMADMEAETWAVSSSMAGDIFISEDDLMKPATYQADRKDILRRITRVARELTTVYSDVRNASYGMTASGGAHAIIATAEYLAAKMTANNHAKVMTQFHEFAKATGRCLYVENSRLVTFDQGAINYSSLAYKELVELCGERLDIEYNYLRAKQIAKEQQAELRAQQREEKIARQEAEKAAKQAERDELVAANAIAKIKAKLEAANADERDTLQSEIDQLQAALDEAHERMERARSRAQDTKQGHVYIISNVGSFGEDVLKIGMTRRMEPMDRVKELGDASVPFTFDVHAMIECDDAPALESQLHKLFDTRRVNKVNRRKEFFTVTVDEIEAALNAEGMDVILNKVPSADEYYQSMRLATAEAA